MWTFFSLRLEETRGRPSESSETGPPRPSRPGMLVESPHDSPSQDAGPQGEGRASNLGPQDTPCHRGPPSGLREQVPTLLVKGWVGMRTLSDPKVFAPQCEGIPRDSDHSTRHDPRLTQHSHTSSCAGTMSQAPCAVCCPASTPTSSSSSTRSPVDTSPHSPSRHRIGWS